MINSSHIYFLLMLDILRGFLQVSHLHLESSWHVCQTYPSAPSYSQQSDQGQYTFFFPPEYVSLWVMDATVCMYSGIHQTSISGKPNSYLRQTMQNVV